MILFRLAYVSQSLLAGDPREREHIADILMTSRRNNEEAEVTGALLASDTHFAQVLEGERQAVEDTYGRITCDKRHENLVLLLAEAIQTRNFPQWSMAYTGPSQSAEEAVARVTRGVEDSKPGDAARELMSSMSRMLDASLGDGPSVPEG